MSSVLNQSDVNRTDLSSNALWEKQYYLLRPFVRKFVYNHKFSAIEGQEDDIVEDLLQDAVLHIFKHLKRAAEGQVAPINSIESFGYITAMNVCRDWWRKERHRLRQSVDGGISEDALSREQVIDPAEEALNLVYEEWVLKKVVKEVVQLPHKTRRALLISLADLMHFGDKPTPLQRAFLQQGIQVSDYQKEKPADPKLRARCISLTCLAYKRLAQVAL